MKIIPMVKNLKSKVKWILIAKKSIIIIRIYPKSHVFVASIALLKRVALMTFTISTGKRNNFK